MIPFLFVIGLGVLGFKLLAYKHGHTMKQEFDIDKARANYQLATMLFSHASSAVSAAQALQTRARSNAEITIANDKFVRASAQLTEASARLAEAGAALTALGITLGS